jgi:hypothetical protein
MEFALAIGWKFVGNSGKIIAGRYQMPPEITFMRGLTDE